MNPALLLLPLPAVLPIPVTVPIPIPPQACGESRQKKTILRLNGRNKEWKRWESFYLNELWPILAGHRPLTGNEGNNRLDNKHHPGSVVQDLAGVQAFI